MSLQMASKQSHHNFIEEIMNAKKAITVIMLIALSLLGSACGGSQDTDVAVIVALTQTAAALENQTVQPTPTLVPESVPLASPQPTLESAQVPATATSGAAKYGVISGTINLKDTSVSPIWVYAVGTDGYQWYKIGPAATGNQIPYSMELTPGVYQLFVAPWGLGYSLDGKTLAAVSVAAGETVTSIDLSAPNQTTCGPSFGVPASPDGNYAAIAGATNECLSGAQSYVPLASTECDALNATLSASVGKQGTIAASVPFEDYVNSKIGSACQISFSATGKDMENFTGLSKPVEDTLVNQGWQRDERYGAAGAGGYQLAYAKGNVLCLFSVEAKPLDRAVCPANQPISVCWETLPPEQKIFNVTLTCAQPSP